MRGTRRLTLVPSLRVSTSSDTGTGLSLAAYFGFAIFEGATVEHITNRGFSCTAGRDCTHAAHLCDNLEFPREVAMPARISEAIVLRTYPLKEADLIVSFLTRDQGKLRGVAKRARSPKGRFGASLERLTHGKIFYFQRETRELVNLDACELIHSHFGLHGDFTVSLALDFITEVSEQFLPAA